MTRTRAWAYWIFIALLVLVNFTLQLALGWEAVPDLLVVALLLGARRLGGAASAALGLFLGLLRDALSLVAFGADAVTMTIIGFLASKSRELFLGEGMVFIAVYLFVGKWLHDAIYFFVAGPTVRGGVVGALLISAPIAAAYAAVVGVVALFAYQLILGER
jgi:rod shape-determining protein MreD